MSSLAHRSSLTDVAWLRAGTFKSNADAAMLWKVFGLRLRDAGNNAEVTYVQAGLGLQHMLSTLSN